MYRRIFRTLLTTALLAVLLTAALTVPALYRLYEDRIAAELHIEAEYILRMLDLAGGDPSFLNGLDSAHRLSWIAPDGAVLYDSAADASAMENHALRPEVAQALQNGSGMSSRRSDTLAETTLYYALRTPSGSVLRIAAARASVPGLYLSVMPPIAVLLLAAVLLSLLVARHSSGRIVAPLNALDLEAPLTNKTYDELYPLLKRMDQQNAQIRRHLQTIESARTELAAVMENMREGIILLDKNNYVLSMNSSASSLFGVQQRDDLHLLSVHRDPQLLSIALEAQHGNCQDMLLRLGGRVHRVFASPVLQNDTVRGAVLLLLDVTDRVSAEESRREFTANVSHELKTPLTSISGYAEIIRDGIALPEDIPAFAGKINSEAARLLSLVNDILELSRLDEKQGLGPVSPVPLSSLLQEILDELDPSARKKSLSVRLSCPPLTLSGHAKLLRELFFNLVDNAIRYTPDHGEIRVTALEEPDCIVCTVADTGVGIPPEHQPHIFERFYRVDKSHSRATGGTGLGLAIVKHVAEIHHAALALESEEGRGTAITIRFPR